MFVNFLIKNKEYLTEENSCFVILTNYMNKRLCRHCKCGNERPFPELRGVLIEAGALIKFFSCEKGRSLEGGVHLDRGALSDNYDIQRFPNKTTNNGKNIHKQ